MKSLGRSLLLIDLIYEPARAINIVGGFSLKTVGDARFPMIVGMLFIWGILPVIVFIRDTWGISLVGLWLCFAFDEIVRAGINLWRWQTGRWKTMGIVEPVDPTAAANVVADPLSSAETAAPVARPT